MEYTPLKDIIDHFNPKQQEATLHIKGPELIIAGAGSGKTSVLTTRIALLLEKGVLPERILALTFTKKAADEMRKRIVAIRGSEGNRLRMGTFHSVFISFIRPYASALGFPENFTILDEDDSLNCLKRCIKDVVENKRPPKDTWTKYQKDKYAEEDSHYKPKEMRTIISGLKNRLVTAAAYSKSETLIKHDTAQGRPLFKDVYQAYTDACFRSCAMDFDDLLLYTDILMSNNPDIKKRIAAEFDYILVDEYQDTNHAQYVILKKLTEKNKNICVVGDDSQSIYGFRGAKIENILNFKKEFEDCKMVKLEQNYRSTQNIVKAANRLISHNTNKIEKTCFSNSEEGDEIEYQETTDERDEANYVANALKEDMKRFGYKYKDFAILYRTNAQSRAIEDALIKSRIPYVVYSGISFFERLEVKDHMAYFKLAVNPHDDESLRRVINKPIRGVGDSTLEKIAMFARTNKMSIWSAINDWRIQSIGLSKKAMEGIDEFVSLINGFIKMASENGSFSTAYTIVNKVGILDAYHAENSSESRDRADNVKELLNSVKTFEEDITARNAELKDENKINDNLANYLQNIMLLSNADTDSKDSDKVNLMTVHCAKGLEFEEVFICGMERDLFPLEIEKTDSELEEERRLFYVAVTRAKKYLVITSAKQRMRFGQRKEMKPSKFIRELL